MARRIDRIEFGRLDMDVSRVLAAPADGDTTIQAVIPGTTGRDTLTGTSVADTISGGEGGDTINGGAGNDTLYGFGAADANLNVGQIDATLVASGLERPVFAQSAPGDPNRMFIIEQHTGQIKILNLNNGDVSLFLDIDNINTGSEEGLLGMAFSPDYATTGEYYVYLTNTDGNNEVWRYTDPDVAPMPDARELVISIPHPGAANHNGGWIGFGPDGNLYIATGDGGGGGDTSNNAQNINSLLGKILRIDVTGLPDGDDYVVPAGNPFAGATPGADEVFALGLRNPWRVSFDSQTGDFWIGDVGQGQFEEIDFVPSGTLGG